MTTEPITTTTGYIPEWTDGDKLRKIRRLLKLSQRDFAQQLGVNPITYGAWEADRTPVRDIRTIARRIKALTGIPLWWWYDDPPPTPPEDPTPPPLLLPRMDSNHQPPDSVIPIHRPHRQLRKSA